jgi:probable phosphoglycerate mutase
MHGRYSGTAEYALSAEGRRQAEQWRRCILGMRDLAVETSPLGRARETAAAVGRPDATPFAPLIEWDLGDLEGKLADDFRSQNPDWNLFCDGPPNGSGETPDRLLHRIALVSDRVDRTEAEHLLLVSHGQFLRALAAVLMGLPLSAAASFSFGPARMGLLTRRDARWSLTGWNLPSSASTGLFNELI